MNINELQEAALAMFPQVNAENLLMLALSGSHAYGTATPESDYDLVGIVAPSEDYIIGTKKWTPLAEVTPELDVRFYTPAEFMSMLMKGSVNNLEVLFYPTMVLDDRLLPWWAARDKFISGATVNSIRGYTQSTLKRFRDPNAGDHGSKRREFIKQYGYDCSAAAHCFRWLWMGMDLYKRPDMLTIQLSAMRASVLQNVKTGVIPADTVESMIRDLDSYFDEHADELRATLGKVPNYLPNRLLINLHRQLLL